MEDILREDVPILSRGPDGMPRRGTQQVSTRVPGAQLSSLADFFTAIGAGPEAAQRQSQNRLVNIQTAQDRQRGLAIEGSRLSAEEMRMLTDVKRERRLGLQSEAELLSLGRGDATLDLGEGRTLEIPGQESRINMQIDAEQRKLKTQKELEEFKAKLRQPRTPSEIELHMRAIKGDTEAQAVLDSLTKKRAEAEERAFARQVRLAELRRTDKPATQAQLRAFSFYSRMADVLDFANTFENEVFNKSTLAGQAYDLNAPNFMKSSDAQQYRQQQRAFTEARLRKESGAAVPEFEYTNDARTYFAQPGDSPETIERKRRSRIVLLQGVYREAGKAAEGIPEPMLDDQQPQVPPNAAAVLSNLGPGIHTLSDGSKWRKDESGKVTRVE